MKEKLKEKTASSRRLCSVYAISLFYNFNPNTKF